MNEFQEAQQLNSLQEELMYSMFDKWAREKRLTQQKVAIVATGAIAEANATVYFPPDLTTASNPFIKQSIYKQNRKNNFTRRKGLFAIKIWRE